MNSVHGYAPDGDVKNVVPNVQPRVSFSILKSGNTLPLLIENLDKITRLRRTEKFLMASDAGEEKTSAERFKEAKVFKYGIFQGLGSKTRSYTSVRYKSEISWRPTKEEVVDLHEKALEAFENGDLIGLSAVTNESQSISFLGNAVREEVDLEFSKSYTGFIDAEDLYQAVNKKRKSLP
ncbi:hypothetical protein [Halomonas caseinilytica]|uniref:hypothetical protein n=1 Tax=Halomonas caseinilytica TaxID=438744 RepID=UPI0011133AF7|nr:hypothetical protein [Halomonas caseinilytica]